MELLQLAREDRKMYGDVHGISAKIVGKHVRPTIFRNVLRQLHEEEAPASKAEEFVA